MPTPAPRRARRLPALVVAVLGAAAAVAACGSSSGAGGTVDPATLVPANAPVYVEATLHADDQEATDARTALAKILRTSDPAGKLSNLLDQSGGRDGIRFDQDVAPWLGDQIGVGVLTFGRGRADAVLVAASTDDAKAQQAIDKIQKGGARRTYRGVDYSFDAADHTAAAVVGDAVVIGSEAGFKGAVDASKG